MFRLTQTVGIQIKKTAIGAKRNVFYLFELLVFARKKCAHSFKTNPKIILKIFNFSTAIMSVIARIISRQIVNRPRFYRQIFTPPSQPEKEEFGFKARKWNRIFLSAGICTGIVGFGLLKDYLSQFVPSLPQVAAATASTSRRAQVRN